MLRLVSFSIVSGCTDFSDFAAYYRCTAGGFVYKRHFSCSWVAIALSASWVGAEAQGFASWRHSLMVTTTFAAAALSVLLAPGGEAALTPSWQPDYSTA